MDGSQSQLTKENFIVTSDVASHHLSFDSVSIKSADDISQWSKNDWYDNVISGMDMRGDDINITNSLITNVYHAVSLRGDRAYYAHNIIDNFAGDGIRGLGDDSTYEFNTVRDCYINDYEIQHDDGFQAYRVASDNNYKIKNVTLRSNKFLLFEDAITPFIVENDLIGSLMQGVIITDGHADSWIVENNLVVNSQYHGISLYGAIDSRIQNNTVVKHPYFKDNVMPRIYVDDQKKANQAQANSNNITTTLTTWTFDETSIVENNLDINEADRDNFSEIFRDYNASDFRLKTNVLTVDSGNNSDATLLDIEGNSRINNEVVDLGAFEY